MAVGGTGERLKNGNHLSKEELKIIDQIKGMILAEQNRKCAVNRIMTINLNEFFSGAYLTKAEAKLEKTIKNAKNSQRFKDIKLESGIITISNQPTAVQESNKGSVDEVVNMIVAMVKTDLGNGADKERSLSTNITWDKLGIKKPSGKKAVVDKLTGYQFKVNGKKENLLKNIKSNEKTLYVRYIVPEIEKAKEQEKKPIAENDNGQGRAPEPKSEGKVTSVEPVSSADVNKYKQAAGKTLGPLGKALAMGAGLMAVSVFGGASFLLVAGVMLASQYLKQQQMMAQNNNAVPQN